MKPTNRDEWAALAVLALRSVKPLEANAAGAPAPKPPAPHPPMTAREWIRLRDQRELDIAYTQNLAAEIALRRLVKRSA
jgi:hypothetical protein